MPSWVEIVPVVLERKFCFKFVFAFSLFRNYLPWEKGVVTHLNKLKFPTLKDALCLGLVESGPVDLENKIF